MCERLTVYFAIGGWCDAAQEPVGGGVALWRGTCRREAVLQSARWAEALERSPRWGRGEVVVLDSDTGERVRGLEVLAALEVL